MNFLADKRKRKIFIIIAAIALSIAIIVGGCAIYLSDYYHADEGAIAVFNPDENVTISISDNGNVIFEPQNATHGLIFYPGGKVEHRAYEPLLAELAKESVLCVIVKMPFNLAVLDMDAADGIQEQYPEIEEWYIGGHSLGGSMAASYLKKNAQDYEGLILLGAYSTTDLSQTDLDVLSIYGSEDQVMNRENYDENKSNLPDGFTEIVIEGGCHAYFGMYGAQDGDGVPTISNGDQICLTTEAIMNMINK